MSVGDGISVSSYPLRPDTIDARIDYIKRAIRAREDTRDQAETEGMRRRMDMSVSLWTDLLIEALEYKQAFDSVRGGERDVP